MPEVVIYAIGGRSQDQKRGLCKDVTEAVMKNYGVPADAVVVTLVETSQTRGLQPHRSRFLKLQ